jgi:hypothetical protein
MMRARLYLLFGTLVLSAVGASQYFGWSPTSGEAAQVDPKTVRANPGAYRSPYYLPGRTLRGK